MATSSLVERFGHARVIRHARKLIEQAREGLTRDEPMVLSALPAMLRKSLDDGLGSVINATGVLLHTNLGRAPWSDTARQAALVASGYTAVELDPQSGKRGHRGAGVEDRICALTGAESALVVNNCAAAVLLMLAAIARDKKVLVSRGELVEIGGGFRVPEVMANSGAQLVEVGTTNKTHLRDYAAYENDPAVGAIMRVHHSNFRQIGFVSAPTLAELGTLTPPLLVDLGSGQIDPADGEPSAREAINAGAAVVCVSGDKLLGGPQAGIAFGRRSDIELMRRHPLFRALRADKVILGALEGTLDDWLRGIPVPLQSMREAKMSDLKEATEGWVEAIGDRASCQSISVAGAVGGGSLPGRTWPSYALAIKHPQPDVFQAALRAQTPPIIGRIEKQQIILDARTVVPLGQSEALINGVISALDRFPA